MGYSPGTKNVLNPRHGKRDYFITYFRHVLIVIISWFVAQLLLILPVTSNILRSLDRKLYDLILISEAHFRPSRQGADDIVIIDIDEQSLAELGQFSTWPTIYFAELVDSLSLGKPLAIGIDIFFTESDSISMAARQRLRRKFLAEDLSTPDPFFDAMSTDATFAEAMERAGNVFLAMFSSYSNTEPKPLPSNLISWNIRGKDVSQILPWSSVKPKPVKIINPIPPIPNLSESAHAVGFAHITSDDRGVIIDYPLFFEKDGMTFVNFSFQMMLSLLRIESIETGGNSVYLYRSDYKENDNSSHARKLVRKLPLDSEGRFRLKFYESSDYFRHISFSDVLAGRIPSEYYENKIILVGASASGLYDQKSTPIWSNVPGIELHATFMANLMYEDLLFYPDSVLLGLFVFLFTLFFILYIHRIKHYWSVPIFLLLLLLLGYMLFHVYYYYNICMNYMDLMLPWALAFIIYTFDQYGIQIREKRKVRNAFEHYVAKDVVQKVMSEPNSLKVNGEKRPATAVFADINNFTTICEEGDPLEVTKLLHEYFNLCTQVITKRDGMLDKFIGDAIVALFNVPYAINHYTSKACHTASDIISIAVSTRKKYSGHPQFSDFTVSIGISTGSMIVGNMGSDTIFNYTAIGDKMNLASRLQGLNNYYSTSILVDKETYSEVNDVFLCRYLDHVCVKGRNEALDIYELFAPQCDIPNEDSVRRAFQCYENGIKAMQAHIPNIAQTHFEEALRLKPMDIPSEIMLMSIKQIDWDSWDGIRYHTDKCPGK